MSRKRFIRNRSRGRKNSQVMDIDITSLLDILVIMLVFLLKSYNSSGIVLNVPKGITLPESKSITQNTSGVIVQVSPTTIWVDDQEIVNSEKTGRSFDRGGRRIIPLFNELIKKKNLIKRIEKTSPNAQKFSGVVNIIVDKSIKYNVIKKLMYTCAEAGYKQY